MKKLSEYRDGDALDLLADLIEPAIAIVSAEGVKEAIEAGNRINAIKCAIKGAKDSVMEVLARLEGVPVSEFHCNVITLPARLLEILNDEELIDFFTEQAQTKTSKEASGSVTENTEGAGR